MITAWCDYCTHIYYCYWYLESFIDTCIYIKTLCATENTGYFESCFF